MKLFALIVICGTFIYMVKCASIPQNDESENQVDSSENEVVVNENEYDDSSEESLEEEEDDANDLSDSSGDEEDEYSNELALADDPEAVAEEVEEAAAAEEVQEDKSAEEVANNDDSTIEEQDTRVFNFSDVIPQKEFDVEKFQGKWFHIFKLKWSQKSYSSEINDIALLKDGIFFARSAHYSGSSCSAVSTRSYTPFKDHVSKFHYGDHGIVKVLYTDYNYTVVYICDEVESNGECKRSKMDLEIMSRNPDEIVDNIDEDIRLAIKNAIIPTGLTKEDFVKNDNSDVTGCLGENRVFKFQDVNPQEEFDAEQFQGKWYSIFKLKWSPKSHSSDINIITLQEDGSFFARAAYHSGTSCSAVSTRLYTKSKDHEAQFHYNEHIGTVKLLYTDYDYTVAYFCNQVESNGECKLSNMEVEMYSRNPDETVENIDEEIRIAARKPLLEIGLTKEDFVKNNNSAVVECLGEKRVFNFEKILPQEEFDTEKFQGKWFHIFKLKWSPKSFSSQINTVSLQEDGSLFARSAYHSDNSCSAVSTRTYTPYKDHVAQFHYNDHHGIVKVLYSNYNYTVVYLCDKVESNGECKLSNMEVEIMSRNADEIVKNIDEEIRLAIKNAIKPIGLTKEDFVKNDNSAVTECLGKSRVFNFQTIQPQEEFDAEKFQGIWYHLFNLKWSHNTYNGEINNISLAEDGSLHALTAFQGENCSPVFRTTYRQCKDHQAMYHFGELGAVKVLYTDYNYTVVYVCHLVESNGECKRSNMEIEIMSRKPDEVVETMDADIRMAIRHSFMKTGIIKDDFTKNNNSDVAQCLEHTRSFNFLEVEAQEEFDAEKFQGIWYHIFKLMWSHRSYNAEINNITLNQDGSLVSHAAHFDGYSCSSIETGTYRPSKNHSALFNFGKYGGVKILYSNYNYTVAYICSEVQRDGHCKPSHLGLEIMSRNPDEIVENIDEDIRMEIKSAILKTGLMKEDFIKNDNSGVIQCLAKEHQEEKSCAFADFSPMTDFDVSRFSGIWHEIERTRYSKWDKWQSGHLLIDSSNDEYMMMQYVGSSEDECKGPYRGFGFNNINKVNVGDYMMFSGEHKTLGNPFIQHWHYLILYTDYDNVALTYSCVREADDGTCHQRGTQVSILSRTLQVNEETKKKLHAMVQEQTCVDFDDLQPVVIEKHCDFLFGEEFGHDSYEEHEDEQGSGSEVHEADVVESVEDSSEESGDGSGSNHSVEETPELMSMEEPETLKEDEVEVVAENGQ